MQAFTAAVDTLYDAVVAFSVRAVRKYVYADEVLPPEGLIAPREIKQLSAPAAPPTIVAPKEKISSESSRAALTRGMVMYAGIAQVPLYKDPAIEFDAQIGTIPFGAMVMAGEPKGGFYPTTWNEMSGWVLREDLADRATHIYPLFVKGQENGVDDTNTMYVRAIIKDEFGLGRSEFPLQAGEYVLYRLWKRGLSIPWPPTRPRVPGVWHDLLKGQPGVHTGLEPRVGCIMEYTLNGKVGHVAYVEAVFPDETISISEVNKNGSGIYNEQELSREEWKQLKPAFIEIT